MWLTPLVSFAWSSLRATCFPVVLGVRFTWIVLSDGNVHVDKLSGRLLAPWLVARSCTCGAACTPCW